MKPFFKELFAYNHHCNQKLVEIFSDSTHMTSEKAIKLYNHVLNAHQIWNNRIESQQLPFAVWDLHAVQDFKSIDQANHKRTLQILEKFDRYEMINYSNSKGQAFSSRIQDILFHIINHSTYHRGQIATEFNQHGLEPLVTDYIFFKR